MPTNNTPPPPAITPTDSELQFIMQRINRMLVERGVTKAPTRWARTFRGLIQPVISETIAKTILSLGIPRGPGASIPQWALDLANEECILAVADVLLKDIEKHGAD